jgi:hypothetical protein
MDPATEDGLFDRAVAYWNARDFHAAHEDWETLWHEAEGTRRDWLQGLIQYAAALFHVERGYYATGFVKLMRSAAERVSGHDARGERMQFDTFVHDLAPWHTHAARVAAGGDLRTAAPCYPNIQYREGVVPRPLPPEPAAPEE